MDKAEEVVRVELPLAYVKELQGIRQELADIKDLIKEFIVMKEQEHKARARR